MNDRTIISLLEIDRVKQVVDLSSSNASDKIAINLKDGTRYYTREFSCGNNSISGAFEYDKNSPKIENTTKGELNGICYRTACDNKRAIFYNHSTTKYYCASCAKLINDANHADAMRLYGHELCTIQEKPNNDDILF